MVVQNPGNVLPFYLLTDWQRHRQIGTDILPYGLIAPNMRLLPFQLYKATGTPGTIVFQLVNAQDDSTTIALDNALIVVTLKSGGGYWLTYLAEENVVPIPDCGFWYVKITDGATEYFSEVLHLKPDGLWDDIGLSIEDCDRVENVLTIEVAEADSLAQPPSAQTVEYYDNSQWNTLGPTGGTFNYQDWPPNEILVRRTVTTASGVTITKVWKIIWSDVDDPCGTMSLVQFGSTTTTGTAEGRWRLRFTNDTDKGTVLYQLGYTQHVYLLPVYAAPLVNRDEEIVVNGFGTEVSRYSRQVERWRFEAPDQPDYLAATLAMLADYTTVLLGNTGTGAEYAMERVSVGSRRQSPSLNIFEFAFDRRLEVFSGCQPNFALD